MSGAYKGVKLGKLKLKGEKKRRTLDDGTSTSKKKSKVTEERDHAEDVDITEHGGWWSIKEERHVRGGCHLAFEWAKKPHCYIAALDNGKFTLGPLHKHGEQPSPEECVALIKMPDSDWIAFKTGYGKYIGVDNDGQLVAIADAVGSREKWELVFQEGQVALQSLYNNCFVSFEEDEHGHIFAKSKTARESEILILRTDVEKESLKPTDYTPAEDFKKSKECETIYIKMYQHSKVDLKNRCVPFDLNDKTSVRQAKEKGTLHETMLDRRVKAKSDRYC